jgi:hypothetical protein
MTTRLLCPNCRRHFRQPTVFPFYCRCGFVILAIFNTAELPEKQPILNCGPGTEMLGLTKELGIIEKPNCSCRAVAKKMDEWGVVGCQDPANLAWIIVQMQANAAKYSWLEKLQVAMSAAASPLALVIDPLDIYGSLVREAIRRADAKTR